MSGVATAGTVSEQQAHNNVGLGALREGGLRLLQEEGETPAPVDEEEPDSESPSETPSPVSEESDPETPAPQAGKYCSRIVLFLLREQGTSTSSLASAQGGVVTDRRRCC